MSSIQTRAMLATLTISMWTARKQDKKVTAEVESVHGAKNAGRFNKDLVDRALLEPITKIAAKIRERHYYSTLSWSDAGARILPAPLFLDYTSKFRELRAEFNAAVSLMIQRYPAEVQAARVRLGTMYDPGDYPDVSDLYGKFDVAVEFTPVPSGDDFRIDLGDDIEQELRSSVTASVASKQVAAVKATYERVRDVVSKIEERLSDDEAVFKDSLINNARDLQVILDALNITNDELLSDLSRSIKDNLLRSPESLRRNPELRKRTAESAREILALLP